MYTNPSAKPNRIRISTRKRSKTPLAPDPRSLSLPDLEITHEQRHPELILVRPTQLKGPKFERPRSPTPSRAFYYFLPDKHDLAELQEAYVEGHQVIWSTTISTYGFRHPKSIYYPVLHRFFLGFTLIAEQYEFIRKDVIPVDDIRRKAPPTKNSPWSKFPHRYHKNARNIYKTMHRRGLRVSRFLFVTDEDISNLGPGEILRAKSRRVYPR